jgi:aquaporin Z
MVSACAFTILFEHPDSPAHRAVADPFVRRLLIGAAMGLTAMALIYSPWGRRSGAHMNPSLTLTFLRLGKVEARDAAGYVAAQFIGGAAGVLLTSAAAGMLLAHPAVHYAATVPGAAGPVAAFAGELAISFAMMAMVLVTANVAALARWTGVLAGLFVCAYIAVEAPLSGMSMNPARTFASALAAGEWGGVWVYFVAPPLGMLAAAEAFVRVRGLRRVHCAKLRHDRAARCIFRCNYDALGEGR